MDTSAEGRGLGLAAIGFAGEMEEEGRRERGDGEGTEEGRRRQIFQAKRRRKMDWNGGGRA